MSDELFSVRGKRFFVTGGASGIGRMITEGLAERGARVFTCGRKREALASLVDELKTKKGYDVTAEAADLSQLSEIERVANRVTEVFGGELDVLVNNAGATWGSTSIPRPVGTRCSISTSSPCSSSRRSVCRCSARTRVRRIRRV
jgi:NAD(P)-dependent dehydrogenase (short-subunit alcohol dehydrogenase family)